MQLYIKFTSCSFNTFTFTSTVCLLYILGLCVVNKRGSIPYGHVNRTPLNTLASLPSIAIQYVYVHVSAGPLASRDCCYGFLLVCLPGCMLRFNLYKITIRCPVLWKGIRSDSLLAIAILSINFISTPPVNTRITIMARIWNISPALQYYCIHN